MSVIFKELAMPKCKVLPKQKKLNYVKSSKVLIFILLSYVRYFKHLTKRPKSEWAGFPY